MANPKYTASVSTSSVDITDTIGGGEEIEVYPVDGDIWVNVTGGTAAAETDGNIIVRQDKPVVVPTSLDTTKLTAIRAGAANVKVVTWFRE